VETYRDHEYRAVCNLSLMLVLEINAPHILRCEDSDKRCVSFSSLMASCTLYCVAEFLAEVSTLYCAVICQSFIIISYNIHRTVEVLTINDSSNIVNVLCCVQQHYTTCCFVLRLRSMPEHTGRFIMYSGITKMYDRKTVRHVFTKPVQIEGTTQKFFSQKFVFHHHSHFCC
jgi:hypothetical protein